MKKALLIDGHSLAYRAFFAVGGLTTKDGQPTNALFGFISMMLQLIKNYSPDQIYVAFDLPQPTFRHELYKEYKAHREKPPDEFISQVPIIKKFVKEMGVTIVQEPGFEADDVIGAMAGKLSSQGVSPLIVTGDKDAFQLVTEDVHVLITKKGISELEEYGPEEVYNRYGLLVEQMIDMKALMGDSSDNIPGVKGIGEKTAIKLLMEYGTLEDVYENIDQIPGKLKEKLLQDKDNAFLSKELVTIKTSIDVDVNLHDTQIDNQKLLSFLKQYELNSLIKRFFGADNIVYEASSIKSEVIDDEVKLSSAITCIKEQKEIALYPEYDDRTGGLIALSIAINKGIVYVIPFGFLTGNLCSQDQGDFGPMFAVDDSKGIKHLNEIFKSEIHKIIFDSKKFIHFLEREGIKLKGTYDDVIIMDYLLDPDRNNRDIDKMLNVYFGENHQTRKDVLAKNKKYHFCEISADKAVEYLAKRAEALLRLKVKMQALLKEEDLYFIYKEMELPLIEILFKMEKEGIKLDKGYLKEMSLDIHKDLVSIEQSIYLLAGEEFNLNSTKQLQEVLFEKLGLPKIRKTKTGYSTNVDVLEELAGRYEIAGMLIEYRQLSKLLNTYIDALPKLTDEDDRLHTTFNSTIAATGRLSSSEPNLQNIPIRGETGSKIRGAFVARPGYKLIVADYSQIELRILAHISRDAKLKDAFQKGMDVHQKTAAEIFGVSLDNVTPEMRRKAKEINFGLAYGMGAYKMAYRLGIDIKEAQHQIDIYFYNFPGIKTYMETTPSFVAENGYIKTLYGRKRFFKDFTTLPKREQSAQIRMIINYPMQGLAADIIKLAMLKLDKEITAFDAKLLLQVHDELIVEVREEQAEKLCKVMVEVMETALDLEVPLVVNASIVDNWLASK